MAENLSVHQHPNGKYGVFDKSTLQPVQPKFSFEKDMYDSQGEANQAVQQRMQAGYQMQPGLGGFGMTWILAVSPGSSVTTGQPGGLPGPRILQ